MIEIYWDDLKPEKQAEILKLLGNNGNWDVFPMFILPGPEIEQSGVETPSPLSKDLLQATERPKPQLNMFQNLEM